MRQKKKKEILGTDTEISLDYFVKASRSSRTWKAQDQWEEGEIGKWVENNRRIRDRYILIDGSKGDDDSFPPSAKNILQRFLFLSRLTDNHITFPRFGLFSSPQDAYPDFFFFKENIHNSTFIFHNTFTLKSHSKRLFIYANIFSRADVN